VDFGKILDVWLDENGTYDKDAVPNAANPAREKTIPGDRRNKLLRKKPDAVIDLHGLNGEEAWTSLETFFKNSRDLGHEKLLVIHGKGNHRSANGNNQVLKGITKRFIENCSFAGESGHSAGREGGTGSTWVFLKERS